MFVSAKRTKRNGRQTAQISQLASSRVNCAICELQHSNSGKENWKTKVANNDVIEIQFDHMRSTIAETDEKTRDNT
jgi:hypothetical protein